MSTSYPIITQAALGSAGKRWAFGLGARVRAADEIPSPLAHEAVVLTDGVNYTSSKHKRLDRRAAATVNATSYCVVDMTRDKLLPVQLPLQSSGLDEFTLRVTFACTVNDEIVVAKVGHRDLTDALLTYLKGYHKLYQLGLQHPIESVHIVQEDAQLELSVYTHASPMVLLGMQVELSSVEVLTPAGVLDEQRKLEERLREHKRRQHEIDLERELQTKQRSYERDDKLDEHRFTRELSREEGETERERLERKARESRMIRDHQREEYEFDHEQSQRALAAKLRQAKMFGQETADDPYAVISYAVASGELNSTELIRRLDEDARRRRDDELRAEQAREDRVNLRIEREWEYELDERRHQHELERRQQEIDASAAERSNDLERDRVRLDIERESDSRNWEATREDRAWTRKNEKLRLEHDIALAQQQIEASRRDQDRQWEQEQARLAHERELRAQELASKRDEYRWRDEKEQKAWEREQKAREQERAERREAESRKLKAQIAQTLIERGHVDHTGMADVILSVVQDITNASPPGEIVQEEVPEIATAEVVEDSTLPPPHTGLPEEEIG
ncbi:hypothetical protein [Acrocarpospora catenulata]|uniref:hypothetical protein n=1 Tax=Acrocarpospora catenulata TaxID=2836182 RepID=UPI001BDA0CB1|nr:hypothetical protein [Acrocarpospora catenulata]